MTKREQVLACVSLCQTCVSYNFCSGNIITGAQFAVLGTFALYFPKNLLKSTTSLGARGFSYLSGLIAFNDAFTAITQAEAAKIGITFANLHGTADTPVGFGTCILMMLFDAFWMLLLALYLEKILPSEFGSPLPWNFCCKRDNQGEGTPLLPQPETHLNLDNDEHGSVIEAVSDDVAKRESISISRLRRVFERGSCFKKGDELVAVDSLNLTMFTGEIFALLGHNGAGKSTTFSILTGLIPATAGTVQMFGRDLAANMDEIRQAFGVCILSLSLSLIRLTLFFLLHAFSTICPTTGVPST